MCGDDHHRWWWWWWWCVFNSYTHITWTCLFRAYFQFSNLYEWFAVVAIIDTAAAATAVVIVAVAAVAVVVIIIFISSFSNVKFIYSENKDKRKTQHNTHSKLKKNGNSEKSDNTIKPHERRKKTGRFKLYNNNNNAYIIDWWLFVRLLARSCPLHSCVVNTISYGDLYRTLCPFFSFTRTLSLFASPITLTKRYSIVSRSLEVIVYFNNKICVDSNSPQTKKKTTTKKKQIYR